MFGAQRDNVERCPIERRTNRWLSNFDQFFVGLPISLYERPHRTSVGPRLAADVVRLVPVFPPGNVSQPPTLSWDASASNRSNGGSAQIRLHGLPQPDRPAGGSCASDRGDGPPPLSGSRRKNIRPL